MNFFLKEIILDHGKNPRYFGLLKDYDFKVEGENPLCGDRVVFTIKVNQGRITKIGHQTFGCLLSRASSSILSQKLIGRKLIHLDRIKVEDVLKWLGIEVGFNRLKCAILPLETIKLVISSKNKKNDQQP